MGGHPSQATISHKESGIRKKHPLEFKPWAVVSGRAGGEADVTGAELRVMQGASLFRVREGVIH